MIIIIFFVYSLLSCLPLFRCATDSNISSPICPDSFSCPSLAPFKYPFYNDTDTSCGLIKVNCTSRGGEIQIEGGPYVILEKYQSRSTVIYNRTFDELLKTNTCDALMDNITSPNPLLFSISVDPFITLFKCANNISYAQETDAYFDQINYNSYNRCKDHDFYYKYLLNNATVPHDLPHTCQVIHLPAKRPWRFAPQEPDVSNLSSLLSSGFSISFNLSPLCEECRKKGGRCDTSYGQFLCLDAKKGKPDIKLILEERKKHFQWVILLLVLGVGAMTILIFIILCLRLKPRWRKMGKCNVNVENFLKSHEFQATKRYSYSQVKKITNNFEVKLGQGGFGSVYRGALTNGNLVAVKVLSEVKGNGDDFINEVSSVGRTCHVNVVSLVGYCSEGRRRALIYEFMPNGSLERFIYGNVSLSNIQLSWEKLHEIAIGIARGLEYLYSGCNTRILHLDIKPHNILLDQEFCPKISDFGLAKLFPEKKSVISMTGMRGTPGYIAPELFCRSFGAVSHKSDVYSYGMMILEMVGGRKNFEVDVEHTSEIYFPHWIYKKVKLREEYIRLHGTLSDEDKEIARKMIIVGLWCIQTNPLSRPTITKVLEMLEGDLDLLEIPPKPYMCSPSRSSDSPVTD